MALIKCAECSAEVSDKAAACPKCGHPVTPTPEPIGTQPPTPSPPRPEDTKERIREREEILIANQISPNAVGIIVGLALLVGGVFAAFWYLPERSPARRKAIEEAPLIAILDPELRKTMEAASKAGGAYFFSEESYGVLLVGAYASIGLGALFFLASAFRRARRLVFCRTCNAQVAALLRPVGLYCDHCETWPRKDFAKVGLLIALLGLFTLIVFITNKEPGIPARGLAGDAATTPSSTVMENTGAISSQPTGSQPTGSQTASGTYEVEVISAFLSDADWKKYDDETPDNYAKPSMYVRVEHNGNLLYDCYSVAAPRGYRAEWGKQGKAQKFEIAYKPGDVIKVFLMDWGLVSPKSLFGYSFSCFPFHGGVTTDRGSAIYFTVKRK